MKAVAIILCALSLIGGLAATNPVQEIEATLMLMTGVVMFCTCRVCALLEKIADKPSLSSNVQEPKPGERIDYKPGWFNLN